ncbi:hypothetical protein FRACYDRAFT_238334 [Fragilariopsis cylindrus CCMP1102]|uniref:Uncharacterized protein n=1 Tax=Fragilariopsis cylindrus CCMP1102 TaxID=635003 RepID=A0A1E7FIE7_9STRA|nr:hypothetical protein FRACYDRAFT_238334 [Fragilariopsis cylindrus CCMP1102]|eukprot:OEU17904.1 hypothetical protein FRACYDRAFT_238334 [Fragilariopsis cylindrus CCMP1102]
MPSSASTKSPSSLSDTIQNVIIQNEMKRMYKVAGIDLSSSPMDPSSEKYLRELIIMEQKKMKRLRTIKKFKLKSSPMPPKMLNKDDLPALEQPKPFKFGRQAFIDDGEAFTGSVAGTGAGATAASSAPSSSSSPSFVSILKKVKATTTTAVVTAKSKKEDNKDNNKENALLLSFTHLNEAAQKIVAATATASSAAASGTSATISSTASADDNDDDDTEINNNVDSIKKQLNEQTNVLTKQTEIMVLLSTHIKELTDQVVCLKDSVEKLETLQQQHKTTKEQQEDDDINNTTIVDNNNLGVHVNGNGNGDGNGSNAAANGNNGNADELQRAHYMAHTIAWRVVSFPFRAIKLYLQFEYRCYLVLTRLMRRDIINPFRDAGVIFQLGFALYIIYSRLGPAIEKAFAEIEKQQNNNGAAVSNDDDDDDDDYYGGVGDSDTKNTDNDEESIFGYDSVLDDPNFQIHAISFAVCLGFLYHIGMISLLYKFFVRDKLPIRIWKDLLAGVEITPSYGLNFGERAGVRGVGVGGVGGRLGVGLGRPRGGVGGGGRRNVARNGNGNNNNNNAAVDAANRAIRGFNDFFMGHNHNHNHRPNNNNNQQPGGAAVAGVGGIDGIDGAAAALGNDNNAAIVGGGNRNRNPIIGLISDFVCLLYSFFVSILPIWNPEQQLRDIRNEEDRIIREQLENEANQLLVGGNDGNKNDANDNDDDSNESEDSVSDNDDESDGSESDNDDDNNIDN